MLAAFESEQVISNYVMLTNYSSSFEPPLNTLCKVFPFPGLLGASSSRVSSRRKLHCSLDLKRNETSCPSENQTNCGAISFFNSQKNNKKTNSFSEQLNCFTKQLEGKFWCPIFFEHLSQPLLRPIVSRWPSAEMSGPTNPSNSTPLLRPGW